MAGNSFGAPIPLTEIESVLAWVDTFKLSRPTKKINRDFSDGVLLAEILCVHYPKLVEMHNYPPRNSHALKLNNWMTLNRKVLKKLKLNLCCNTMEQLANCAPGMIERVLVMVRDKIRRDEELNKCTRDTEQNVSSGGSYYEACDVDGNEHVLVVPVKMRVNGVLETIQQKVIRHDSYITLKEEFKDVKDTAELLRQRVEHLDSLLKLKDERIEELQKQLERKQSRRREVDTTQSNTSFPPIPPDPEPVGGLIDNVIIDNVILVKPSFKIPSTKSVPIPLESKSIKPDESKIPIPLTDSLCNKVTTRPSLTRVAMPVFEDMDVDRIKSDVFVEAEVLDERVHEVDEFKDSEQEYTVVTIEETIQKEVKDLSKPIEVIQDIFN